MLFPGEKVFTPHNSAELLGNGQWVMSGGDRRLLARIAPPAGYSSPFPKFEDHFVIPPRAQWSDMLKAQVAGQGLVSDYQNFPPHDQNGTPQCWANGPAGAMTVQRVMQGLPYVEVSAASVAVPISGGNRGGWEQEALEYYAQHGGCPSSLWPNYSTDRSLLTNPECEASRPHFKSLEWYDLGNSFENYAAASLYGFPQAVAYNWWSHVVMCCDLVEISPGKFGLRIRNNWGKWGVANRFGFFGYQVLEEGHGTPSSGHCLRQVTASLFNAA